MRAAISCGLVLAATAVTSAAEPTGQPYQLEDVKYVDAFVGSREARSLLARQGMVVTDEQFKQIFSAYIGGGAPKFITVDSAWHTYHVLLEEGLRIMETRQADVLQRFSEKLVDAANAARRRQQPGVYADLARFAAVGWGLQDPSKLETLRDEDKAVVAEAIRLLNSDQAWTRVLFFGLPVSPQRLHASSFYTNSALLRGYFAARQWYATCNFRLGSETETERALHLIALIESDEELKALHRKLTEPYDVLLGPPDDAGVRDYAAVAGNLIDGGRLTAAKIPGVLDGFRREAAALPDPKVNDQLLSVGEYTRFAEQTKGFRLLPPRRLPSAVLFQNTVDPAVKGRMFPSGIDLFAAGPLACDAGRRALRKSVADAGISTDIENTKVDPLPDSLHGKALDLFKLLQEPLPESAPTPLRTAAWHDKQLSTALGAWAEQRHTWALQSKLNASYMGAAPKAPGFVSPYPEFFCRLGRLARDTSEVLQTGGSNVPSPKSAAEELLACVKLIRPFESDDVRWTDEERYERFDRLGQFLWQFDDRGYPKTGEETSWLCREMEQLARRWTAEENLKERDRELIAALMQPEGAVEPLLHEFADLCDKLAVIARKQIEGTELSEGEIEVLTDYGENLAKFHFYGGNSWLTPRDDFPIVTPVYTSPIWGDTLYAAVARPEALWVIVHYQGQPVLHRGAVLSYREFRRPTDRPLDDEAWATEVRSGRIPPPPRFTRSFRKAITVDEVVQMILAGKSYSPAETMHDPAITRAIVERLTRGEPEASDFGHWARQYLCWRAGDEDVGDLLDVLQKTPKIHIGKIAACIARLDWKPHRAALMDLLRHKRIQYADSAAYILSERPEDVDLPALASVCEEQSPRTRRLCCYVLGHLERSDEDVTDLLLKMLGDEHAAVRYQAALAAARRGVPEPRIVRRLIDGLDDPNEFAGAVMARALVDLEIAEAAPRMLARLQRLTAARDGKQKPGGRESDFTNASDYPGLDAIKVLTDLEHYQASLPDELIAAMGAFRYTPAQEQLRSMLSGRHGAQAFHALSRINPAGEVELAMQVALDGKAAWQARQSAFQTIASSGEPDRVAPLLPLLDDQPEDDVPISDWICSTATDTVGVLLAKGGRAGPEHEQLRRQAMHRLRKLLRGESGRAAMEALIRIDPASRATLPFQIALDSGADADVRQAALFQIASSAPFAEDSGRSIDPNRAVELLPLLNDTSAGDVWDSIRICQRAAEAVADLVYQGANEDTKRTVTEHLREMLRREHGPAALDALVRMERHRRTDLLFDAAFDKELHGNTRARAVERIRWIDDGRLVTRLVPLLDDKSKAKDDLRICDVAAETILSVATSTLGQEFGVQALKELQAEIIPKLGEHREETRATKNRSRPAMGRHYRT